MYIIETIIAKLLTVDLKICATLYNIIRPVMHGYTLSLVTRIHQIILLLDQCTHNNNEFYKHSTSMVMEYTLTASSCSKNAHIRVISFYMEC